jgi:lipopolysaccharide transport system permease protein
MAASVSPTHTQARRGRLADLSPLVLFRDLIAHRNLIRLLARRDVTARYRGSFLGLLWSLITPLVMLVIYAVVFAVAFKAKWNVGGDESKIDFALILFAGLVVFNVFAESVARASTLVTSNPSYVKRVVFPLQILPVVALYAAFVQALISLCILIPAWAIAHHTISKTIWLFPLTMLPLCFLSLGLGWLLAALGVFIRDIAHPVGIAMQALVFVSGIFFPMAVLPAGFQTVLKLNPLVYIIEDGRRTLLWGMWPDWKWWAITTVTSLVVMQIGYWWFNRSRRAFADVI